MSGNQLVSPDAVISFIYEIQQASESFYRNWPLASARLNAMQMREYLLCGFCGMKKRQHHKANCQKHPLRLRWAEERGLPQ